MMRYRYGVALVAMVALASACQQQAGSVSLESDDAKASYAIGQDVGRNLAPTVDRLDRAAFMKGVEDMLDGAEAAVPAEELQAAMQAFSEALMADRAAVGDDNRAAGEAFLAENGAKDGVVTTDSGLQYEVLREGDGPMPTAEDQVRIHYRGTLIDGTEFDTSYGREPAVFQVGGVIAGFTEALLLMPVGSQYRIAIPGDLAYGANGAGALIGPNATLVFELELLEIVE